MCVRADVYNLILIFASYYYTPWPWSCIIILRMIRERHVQLLYCLYSIIIVIYNFEMLVWGTYNYSYSYLASFQSSCIVYTLYNYDSMIIQVYC